MRVVSGDVGVYGKRRQTEFEELEGGGERETSSSGIYDLAVSHGQADSDFWALVLRCGVETIQIHEVQILIGGHKILVVRRMLKHTKVGWQTASRLSWAEI